MCEPATLTAIGTTIVSAGSAAVATAPTWAPIAVAGLQMAGGAQDARRAAKASDAAAINEGMSSAERASRLRAQGLKVLAEQRLQQLSSGIEGGSGSALEIGSQDAAELELDALTELYGGTTRKIALQKQAKQERATSRLLTAGAVGAVGLLGAAPLWGAFGGSAAAGKASVPVFSAKF